MKKNNEKVTRQKRNKRQRIMATVVASISSVALLTTATYAWFSLTNAAQVNQLTLKAGTTGSLLISNSATDGFSEAIDLELPSDCCLRPLSTLNGTSFHKPIYGTDGVVESVNTTAITNTEMDKMVNKSEANGGWIIKKTFYLKANTKSELTQVGIKLLAPKNTESGTTITNGKDANDKPTKGAEAIRISFTCNDVNNGITTKIFEPNADATFAEADADQAELSGWSGISTIKQSANHLFMPKNGSTYTDYVSEELFRIPTNQAVEVTMYIWLEGADKECVNKIVGNAINAQIRFISEDMN